MQFVSRVKRKFACLSCRHHQFSAIGFILPLPLVMPHAALKNFQFANERENVNYHFCVSLQFRMQSYQKKVALSLYSVRESIINGIKNYHCCSRLMKLFNCFARGVAHNERHLRCALHTKKPSSINF